MSLVFRESIMPVPSDQPKLESLLPLSITVTPLLEGTHVLLCPAAPDNGVLPDGLVSGGERSDLMVSYENLLKLASDFESLSSQKTAERI